LKKENTPLVSKLQKRVHSKGSKSKGKLSGHQPSNLYAMQAVQGNGLEISSSKKPIYERLPYKTTYF